MKVFLHFAGLALVVVGAGALADWPGVAIALGAYALVATTIGVAYDRLAPDNRKRANDA